MMKTTTTKTSKATKATIAPAPIGSGKRAYGTNKALGGTFRWEADTEEALSKIMFSMGISKSDAVRYALRVCAAGI
jgi:hypothetical protein